MPTETLTPIETPTDGAAPALAPVRDIPIVRICPDNATVLTNLGLLGEMAGSWHGHGFNLIGRPDFQNKQTVYLQLNQTDETLKIDPIGSSIPNRGFGQNDIELFGLTYLQKISDVFTGGALHIEPGIWVTQPCTTYPPESAPQNEQIVARMANVPHGNSLLAQGTARRFTGAPVLKTPTAEYAFSDFPSFNTTPFAAATPATPAAPATPEVFNAAGSSEKLNAAAAVPPLKPFTPYDVSLPSGAGNPRTPFNTTPADPPLPNDIKGVAMQDVINDPITLLQQVITQQQSEGHTFEGVVLNISTEATLLFRQNKNDPAGPIVTVKPSNGGGGIKNLLFLDGEIVAGKEAPNAHAATVYATFWIEKVMHPHRPPFVQLQYAQMVVLNFPIFALLPTIVNIGWPHVSVGTLKKSFV